LVITGGGPGVMEAANLGAALSTADHTALTSAIDRLATAPHFADLDPYTRVAVEVRATLPLEAPAAAEVRATLPPEAPAAAGDLRATQAPGGAAAPASEAAALSWARHGGLSVPTWLYGHEPANLFAARIAKYFSNAIREDTILRLARGGIVFAPGRAGTVQEVFQAATKAFYATDGASGPFIFLDTAFWTGELPIESLLRPLLAGSPHGDLSTSVHVTDDVDEAVGLILEYGAPAAAKETQHVTP
ncbi:MAG: hypothetical protein ACRDTM_14345, partial [Micromonosporaceae bacterium]